MNVHGTRDNGTRYTFKTYFPITKLGLTQISLPLNLTEAERLARVKAMVMANVPANGVIYEQSRERYHVDEHGVWKISEESVSVNAAGHGATQLVMDRHVGTLTLKSQFLFSESICRDAFEEHQDTCCAPRQLAAVLKLEVADVCREMDEIEKKLYHCTRPTRGRKRA